MKCFAFRIEREDPLHVMSSLHALPYTIFLDSSDTEHELGRRSYVAFKPLEMIESKNGNITITNKSGITEVGGDPFTIAEERLEAFGFKKDSATHSSFFQGGLAGYFGYDLARQIETLPREAADEVNVPDMALGLYDQVYAWDHDNSEGWHFVHAHNKEEADLKHQVFMKIIHTPYVADVTEDYSDFIPEWSSTHTPDEYCQDVQKVIDYIYAGDTFQVNLSQAFQAELPRGFDTYQHYLRLREDNAAPYGAYLNLGSLKISSCSPELFLKVENRRVETRPIKGTRRRAFDRSPIVDVAAQQELLSSTKDRAENAMIVDLLRNDISKVCTDHSVNVPKLCELETFARVHHLVSTVEGSLRADQSSLDLLRACFPGGSITGAPKVRSMEIIESLEPLRRGPYCGAIGYIGFNGLMETNIVIRTLVYNKNKVRFNVGGGIVASSNPNQEYWETMHKAEAIFDSFKPKKKDEEKSLFV